MSDSPIIKNHAAFIWSVADLLRVIISSLNTAKLSWLKAWEVHSLTSKSSYTKKLLLKGSSNE